MRKHTKILSLLAVLAFFSHGIDAGTMEGDKAPINTEGASTSPEIPTKAANGVPTWLVGAWALVRYDDVYPDGRLVEPYGSDPQGLWVIDAQGRYAMQIVRGERGRQSAGDESDGSFDEDKMASIDTNAYYGWLRLRDTQLYTHIDRALYSEWDNRDESGSFQLQGNLLTYSMAKSNVGPSAGVRSVVMWQHLSSRRGDDAAAVSIWNRFREQSSLAPQDALAQRLLPRRSGTDIAEP